MAPTRKIISPLKKQRFGKYESFPKSIRPVHDEPYDYKPITKDDGIVVYRRGQSISMSVAQSLERRAIPIEQRYGSIWERIFFKSLRDRKIPFSFQHSQGGGRMQLGGLVADFLLLDRPLVIQVQGSFWHTGTAVERRDDTQNDRLRGMGYVVEELWDYTIKDIRSYHRWLRTHIDVPVTGRILPGMTRTPPD